MPNKKSPNTKNWLKKKITVSKSYQDKAFSDINELVVKMRSDREVTLIDNTKLIDFLSCSYLGLDQNKQVVEASGNNIHHCGVNFSVARTRMKIESFVILETLLNTLFCNSYTTTFASLHLAHLGILPLLSSGEMPSFPLARNGPIFILDKVAHASIQINRGILSQFGEVILTDFQSLEEIERCFKYAASKKLTPIAVSDSICSMGGSTPVVKLLDFAEAYNGYIYLDDAHGTSIYGKHGCGYALEMLGNKFHPRLILAASLSKGFGANGGVIAVPTAADEIIIKHFSPTYTFGNPLPLSTVDAAITSAKIHLSEEIYSLQSSLRENIAYFDFLMGGTFNNIVNYKTLFPIRGILIGDEFKTISCSKKLIKQGHIAMAAIYPTVAEGKGMLRITFSASHKKNEIFDFCNTMKEILCSYQTDA